MHSCFRCYRDAQLVLLHGQGSCMCSTVLANAALKSPQDVTQRPKNLSWFLEDATVGTTPPPLGATPSWVSLIYCLAGEAQLNCAWPEPSELKVLSSIFGDSNVSFDFPLIRVYLDVNTRKTEH